MSRDPREYQAVTLTLLIGHLLIVASASDTEDVAAPRSRLALHTCRPTAQAERRSPPLGPTAADSNVDELVSAPHRVDASRAARDLHIRPVREPEQWPSHKIAHGVDCSGARASSAVQARARSLQPIAASVYRQGRMTEIIDPDKKSE